MLFSDQKTDQAKTMAEALDEIMKYDDLPALKKWLQGKEDGVNERIWNGNNPLTPLMLSIMWKSERCTEYLIQEGADIHAMDRANHNALHFAAKYSEDNVPLCEKLIHLGCDPSLKNKLGQALSLLARQVGNHKLIVFFEGIENLLREKKALTELLLPPRDPKLEKTDPDQEAPAQAGNQSEKMTLRL